MADELERVRRQWAPAGLEARFVAWEHFAGTVPTTRTFNALGHWLYEERIEYPYRLVIADMSDAELLAVPGVGRVGLRTVRARFPYRPVAALLRDAAPRSR
jgi:hypothetical protein